MAPRAFRLRSPLFASLVAAILREIPRNVKEIHVTRGEMV
jgi:hypothetical protein